jgi:hypothetical protein
MIAQGGFSAVTYTLPLGVGLWLRYGGIPFFLVYSYWRSEACYLPSYTGWFFGRSDS